MRPASCRAVTLWISVLCLLAALFSLNGLASAQAAVGSKRNLSRQSLLSQDPVASTAAPNARSKVTTDTWQGGASGDWSVAANWNNGAIGSGYDILIGTTTAATTVDQSFTIGTLTLSNVGDSVTIANGEALYVGGNISNAGTITLDSTANYTDLILDANVTLSGGGTLVLGSGTPYNTIQANSAPYTLTNQSTIEGQGQIGVGTELALSNSGTINANVSGGTLLLNSNATNTNSGTLEATNGGTLELSGVSWTNTGGTITAATGSAVVLANGVTVTGGTFSTSGSGWIYGDGATLAGTVTNTGQFEVQNGYATTVSGTINNTGTITLDSTSTYTYLLLDGNVTLSGSGTLVLGSATPYNYIEATGAGNTLTNESTIEGQGQIGVGTDLVLVNSGTINANVSGDTLLLNQAGAGTNSGTLEATGGGTLTLDGSSWTNTGGTITAAAGSAVVLEGGVTVTGGTLNGSGTGIVYGDGATLVGLTTEGNFQVQNGYTTNIQGTINNTGTITLASTSTYTKLDVTASGATLSGGGTVVMGGGAQYAYIDGPAGASFTNSNNTIEGTGMIGNADLTLVNNGTINANVSPTVLNAPLELYSGSGGITNTGTLEATNGGELYIFGSTLTNSGSGAVIKAVGADSSGNASYVLLNGDTINGGTLTTSGAGVIYGEGGTTLVGVTNAGNFQVINGQVTYISGTITNTGTITLGSTSTYAYLDLNGANATLTGGGTVVMGAGAPYALIGSGVAGNTLTNSNNTIEGDGYIGDGEITFVNNGTVNANTSGQTLLIQPISAGTDTNTATMEATNGGTLELYAGSFANTGGTITAATGSAVDLNDVTITGGTLTTSGTGVVYGYNNTTLAGLTNAGNFQVINGYATYLSGTITNTGTMTLGSTSTWTYLDTAANTTLTGGGTIVMGSGAQYSVMGGAAGTTLTNSNNTIEGDGYIGDGQISFVNNATVNANTSGQTLELDPVAGTNTKTMEATGGGQLELYGSSWTNTGGTITAATGSDVLLYGTTVTGGTLTTSGTGIIYGEDNATLVGLTNAGSFQVPNGWATYLSGTITNTGTITVASSTTYTYLDLAANTTLSGSGTVIMGAGAQYSEINGASGLTFTNSGNTIEGDGYIGLGDLVVTNKTGSMIANVSGQNLTINSAGAGTTNDGTLEGTNGGNLVVQGTLTNYASGTNTLTGGTYVANGGNVYLPLGTSGGLTALSVSATEENGGQIYNSNNSNNNALSSLTSITSTGALTIGGVAFTDAGSFSNAGSLTILSGESFKVGSLTQISGGSLTAGTYVLDGNLSLTGATQTITTNATNLTLAGGTIENANSTNALAGLATNTGKLTIGGSSNSVSSTAASFNNTGTLTINASDSFSVGNLTQISGTTLSGGTFVLGGNLDLTTAGISIKTNSSTLTLEGGTINSNGVNALSGLAANTKSLTIAGSGTAVATSAASFSNTGTLTIDASDSFTAAALTQLTGAAGSKTLSAGTYVLAGNLDLTTSGLIITTNSATLTLEGGTINSNGVNALGTLAANTKSLTIAGTSTAVATSAASFSNTGTLTIDAGDSFSAPALTQITTTGGITTLTAGTYVLGGNLDLTTAENITVNSAVLTLEGGSIKTGTTNDLANLNSNTNSLTLAGNASFTATGNFSNSGALTIDKGSTFTLTGSNLLTNLASGTLTGGTYTIGGTLKLTSANGGITTNAANLTLTGTAAKIDDGTANALAGFDNNTGTFTLAGDATLTTATTANFSNSGTVDVEKGSKLTVGGTGHNYNQTAGTTTVDGTLTATGITATGGSIFGAGTLKGNTSVGNATGAAATLNVGDSGKAGLLAITGTYTQLDTGTMNVSIGGLTAGTFSVLSVSGNTSLGGNLTAAIVNGLVLNSGNIGQTWTILTTTGTLTGSFTNGTITAGTDAFTVSYTGNSVVLTLTSVTGPAGAKSKSAPASQAAIATAELTTSKNNSPGLTSGLRQTSVVRRNNLAKPILVAGWGHSNATVARGSELNNLRSWQPVPVIPVTAQPVAVARIATAVNSNSAHNNVAHPNLWVGDGHATGAPSTLAGWRGNSNSQRVPVKMLLPSLPRAMR